MTKVKVCCITSCEEADLARRYGAHALGLVSWMPSGEGIVSDRQIQKIAFANRDQTCFLLTCKKDPNEVADQVKAAGTDTVQIVDRMTARDLVHLRNALPGVSLVQVIHVAGTSPVDEALEIEPFVDVILLDSGTPDGPVRTLGGTGKVHDWGISAEIVQQLDCPVFLAGGLGPDNVTEAIRQVQPYGVDVCSRLRPNGHLDEQLLNEFFEAVRAAA